MLTPGAGSLWESSQWVSLGLRRVILKFPYLGFAVVSKLW